LTLDETLRAGGDTLRWLAIVAPVGGLIGSACALFLWLLDVATTLQWQHPWLLFLLPVAGVAIGALYHLIGGSAEGGNNLVIEQIHEPGAGVPSRMGPLVLVGTLATHLFGGSAGREGTALQMGGSIAGTVARWLQLPSEKMRVLLMAGVAAGFAGVFGTPLAGTVFAMEVLAVGRMRYDALLPCLIGALAADAACTAWGIHHTVYRVATTVAVHAGHPLARLDGRLVAQVAVAAVAFGLASTLFAELMHGLQRLFKRIAPHPALRPAVGGIAVIALVYAMGTRDFLGLGVQSPDPNGVSIVSSFAAGGAHPWSWWWKTLFTAVTLGAGFKGGEVTPLFFIGATLGNTLATLFGAPVDLFAALGFVAVFAGATNAPLACTIMGIELFGATYGAYFALACFLAYLLSGHSGIYSAQRLAVPKVATAGLPDEISLGALRTLRAGQLADRQTDVPAVPAQEADPAQP
jgi:H+/Cl- antiporter ClcA